MEDLSAYPYPVTPGTVYFIGAGPGSPDLLTLRGRDILSQADLVLYADSLVDPRVGSFAPPTAECLGSLKMELEEILERMVAAARRGGVVARVHSGDPAVYGAIHEQMARLDDAGVPYEIIPGVSAAFAAAARLKTELTVPNLVQTVIMTRISGRTPVPEGEALAELARTGASLAIFLSVTRMKQVVRELLAGGRFTPETPVAVVHRLSWPDEGIVTGTLSTIAEQVREAGYTRQALILVSPALDPAVQQETGYTSHLYDGTYTHRFRRASQRTEDPPAEDGKKRPIPAGAIEANRTRRDGTAIVAITRAASELARRLAPSLKAVAHVPAKFDARRGYQGSVIDLVRRQWAQVERLVLLMPMGVAVRAIGPLAEDKRRDPAVVVADERGQQVVATLGGHLAGAGDLAREIAALTGGRPVLTTASDVQERPALDLWIRDRELTVANPAQLTAVTAALVNGEPTGAVAAEGWQADLAPFEVSPVTLDELMLDSYQAGLIISDGRIDDAYGVALEKSLLLRPRSLVLGIGCRRGATAEEIEAAIRETLAGAGLAEESVHALATAELKQDEAGLQAVAERRDWPLYCYPAGAINGVEATAALSASAATRFGLQGVAEPCALLAAGAADLLHPKRVFDRVTIAIARRPLPATAAAPQQEVPV